MRRFAAAVLVLVMCGLVVMMMLSKSLMPSSIGRLRSASRVQPAHLIAAAAQHRPPVQTSSTTGMSLHAVPDNTATTAGSSAVQVSGIAASALPSPAAAGGAPIVMATDPTLGTDPTMVGVGAVAAPVETDSYTVSDSTASASPAPIIPVRAPVRVEPWPAPAYNPVPQPVPATLTQAPLVTVFLAPFGGTNLSSDKSAIQHNSIAALAMLPLVNVVLFTDDEFYTPMVKSLGVRIINRITTNQHGTPVLRSMFLDTLALPDLNTPLLGYINADILLVPDFVRSLLAVMTAVQAGAVHERLLVVGRRYNLDAKNLVSRKLVIDPGAGPADVLRVQKGIIGRNKPRPFMEVAEDYFIFTRTAFDWTNVPAFVIGRPGYDNWLVDYAIHLGVDTVDASATVLALHQTDKDGSKAGHKTRPDMMYNIHLMNDHKDHGKTGKCRLALRYASGDARNDTMIAVTTGDFLPGPALELVERWEAGKFTLPTSQLERFNKIDCKRHKKWWPCVTPP